MCLLFGAFDLVSTAAFDLVATFLDCAMSKKCVEANDLQCSYLCFELVM